MREELCDPPHLSLHQPQLLSPALVLVLEVRLSSQPSPSHRCSPHPLCKSTAFPVLPLNPRGAALLPDVEKALLSKLSHFFYAFFSPPFNAGCRNKPGEGGVKIQPRAGHCLTLIFHIHIRDNHTVHVNSSLFSLPFLPSFVLLLLPFMFHDASNVRNLLIFLDRFCDFLSHPYLSSLFSCSNISEQPTHFLSFTQGLFLFLFFYF